MTDLILARKFARRSRRQGWTARALAALSDAEWERTLMILAAEELSEHDCAEMVDLILSWEVSEAQYGLTTVTDVDIRPEIG